MKILFVSVLGLLIGLKEVIGFQAHGMKLFRLRSHHVVAASTLQKKYDILAWENGYTNAKSETCQVISTEFPTDIEGTYFRYELICSPLRL